MYTVYCHTFPHGKVYVGITRQSPIKRWKDGHGYRRGFPIGNAIRKWGWENIDHDIIAEVETLEEAEGLEQYLIALFKSTDSNYGYNILPGGNVSRSVLHEDVRQKRVDSIRLYWQDPALRKKQSDVMRQRWRDKEFRERQSTTHTGKISPLKGKNSPLKGRAKSDETKRKISLSRKGKFVGEKSPLSKPILQYTKDGEFVKRWACVKDVERAGIAGVSSVSAVARGMPKHLTAGGFVWKYESDVEKVMDKTP